MQEEHQAGIKEQKRSALWRQAAQPEIVPDDVAGVVERAEIEGRGDAEVGTSDRRGKIGQPVHDLDESLLERRLIGLPAEEAPAC